MRHHPGMQRRGRRNDRDAPPALPPMTCRCAGETHSTTPSWCFMPPRPITTGEFGFPGTRLSPFAKGGGEKGAGLIREAPGGFLADDAGVRLGVGKNMVESIKHWRLQTGLLKDSEATGSLRIAELGRFLFGEDNIKFMLATNDFARAVTGLAERFNAAWRPCAGTAALSPKEEKAVAALFDSIRQAAKDGKVFAATRRAALLRANAEHDEGRGHA